MMSTTLTVVVPSDACKGVADTADQFVSVADLPTVGKSGAALVRAPLLVRWDLGLREVKLNR